MNETTNTKTSATPPLSCNAFVAKEPREQVSAKKTEPGHGCKQIEFQTMIPSLEPNSPVAPGTHHHNEQTRGHAETHKHRSHHNASQESHQRVFRTDPECLVCRLHSLFSGIVHFPLTIHSTAQFVECIFKKGICSTPTKCPNSCHSFLLNRTYLSTTDLLAWVPGPSACFFNKISLHLFQIFFRV